MFSRSTIIILLSYHFVVLLFTVFDVLILRRKNRDECPDEVSLLKVSTTALFIRWQTFLSPTIVPLAFVSFVSESQMTGFNLETAKILTNQWGLILLTSVVLFSINAKWLLLWNSSYADISISPKGLHYRPYTKWYTFSWSTIDSIKPVKFRLNPIQYGYYLNVASILQLPRWQRWYLTEGYFNFRKKSHALMVNLPKESAKILQNKIAESG